MFNPCIDCCFVRYGKLFTDECYSKCDYAIMQQKLDNIPLTIEQLKKMSGKPIWIKELDTGMAYWRLVNEVFGYGVCLIKPNGEGDYGGFEYYNAKWIAYLNEV